MAPGDMTEKLLTGTLSLNTTNQPTLSWHTSARAEAGLFSSYKVLKVGGVMQYDSDE